MFPTEPIRRYISLSFAKKLDETAKTYAEEHAKIRPKMSPNSGMYFQAVVTAGVRLQQSKIEAYIEIVRAACREADRPVDSEVRNFMLGQIHSMCQSGKNHVVQAVAREINQSGMSFPEGLLPALTAQANTRISAIESEIEREFKIEELKEGIRQSVEVARPVQAAPSVSMPILAPVVERTNRAATHRWTRDQKIGAALILIALVTLIVMITTPEIRSRLRLDRTPGTSPRITTPGQSPAKSGRESNGGKTSSKPPTNPGTLPAPKKQPRPLLQSPAVGGNSRDAAMR